ncbi:hypothetical protein [Thalassomonas haliotis]|uniref:Uncharacterized protein n=1 Tax=Thalassomonas haliotis TaxID=485448 RepID=A0ABY7VJQ2_9GAMM|nr:hypothetical protein [Thalassomonas haliotis]WDE13286.1 hypothetical protein H3N35_07555 [Thalassomonas haliotis]
MKPYADYFNWEGMLLAGLYALLLLFILWGISARLLNNQRERIITCIGFIFLCLFSAFAACSSLFPYFPDTIMFAELVELNENHHQALGVILYFMVSLPLRLISFFQIEVYLVFQQFIFVLALLFLWQAWKIHSQQKNAYPGMYEIFFLLALLYPSTLLFITIPLREFIQILGFCIFLYGLAKFIYFNKLGWMVIGGVITLFVRPQLVIFYPFLILLAKHKNLLKLGIYGLAALPFAVLLFESIARYKFKVSWFAYVRNAGVKRYYDSGMTYGTVEWDNFGDVILDIPVLALQFILSPLPILHSVNPLNLLMLFLDLCFVLVVLFGAFSVKKSISGLHIKLFLFSAVLFSVWEFYIGGAVRHRYPLVLMLIPIAGMYYSIILSNLLSSRFSRK